MFARLEEKRGLVTRGNSGGAGARALAPAGGIAFADGGMKSHPGSGYQAKSSPYANLKL